MAGRIRRFSDAQAPDLAQWIQPDVRLLNAPDALPDIDVAAITIADAIISGKPAALITDYDVDGIASHTIIKLAFRDYFRVPESRIYSFIAHRVKDGYGVSDGIAEKIIATLPAPGLCLTADQGSTSYTAIRKLADAKHLPVITDHHGLGAAGIPTGAIACVNPMREDSAYPDRMIAGVTVAWLVMCAVRRELIVRGYLSADAPKLGALLSYCALGTIADATDMNRSRNNRAIVHAGLALMNRAGAAPAFIAARQGIARNDRLSSIDLAMYLAPRLNAVSRVHEGLLGLRFLTAATVDEAKALLLELDALNTQRKAIDKQLRHEAMRQAEHRIQQGAASLAIALEHGHVGVHGVSAGRVLAATGRPTIIFSTSHQDPDMLSGSMRCPPGVDGRRAMKEIDAQHPGCIAKWGGHAAALGAHVHKTQFLTFATAFEAAVLRQVQSDALYPRLFTDGEIAGPIALSLIDEIQGIEPFGRVFEAPVFTMNAVVDQVRAMGDGTHLRLTLIDDQQLAHEAVWFAAKEPTAPLPVAVGAHVRVAFKVDQNTYRGRTSIQLIVETVETTPASTDHPDPDLGW